MTRITAPPDRRLKPFIYGLAFEEGLVSQETIIEDRPADFFGYRPRNFDMNYQGDVSVREALQLSVNVPAIRLLDAIGPSRLMVRFRRARRQGRNCRRTRRRGLRSALGGVGITLRELVQLYAGLANQGAGAPRQRIEASPAPSTANRSCRRSPPGMSPNTLRRAATGGSRRHASLIRPAPATAIRDAWSVGFDGRYVLGVWVGRADNGAGAGLTGYGAAAPILFEGFAKAGIAHNTPARARPQAPSGLSRPICRSASGASRYGERAAFGLGP